MSIVTLGFFILTYLYKDDIIFCDSWTSQTFFFLFLNLSKDHAIKGKLREKYPIPVEASFLCFSIPKIPAVIGENERFAESQLTSIPVKGSPNFIGKGRAVPLQAWSGPEGSRKLRFPDFMTTEQDGGKVVSLTHRPPLPPGNTPGTHFC